MSFDLWFPLPVFVSVSLWCVVCPHRLGLMVVRRKQVAVQKETDGKHREERNGYLVSCERRSFLRKPLLLMAGKNGIVVSVQSRTYGRQGDAAGAIQALHPCYR